MIDLFNREIIGLSVGWHKTAKLVKQAIQSIPDEILGAFGIIRSLSQAGCPYDNTVAEST